MKKTILLIISLSLIHISYIVYPISNIYAATSTESADIDPETIKENIKKRIEQVIKNQSTSNKKRIAYVGTLNSVTTNSFSLEIAGGGTKQASTSATTVVVELAKNKEVSLEDISIGDYVAALGYLNEDSNVLDARRILVLKDKPTPSTRKTTVGLIKSIDQKKNLLILNSSSTQQANYKISTKTNIQAIDNSSKKTKILFKDIPIQANCLIIFEPSDDLKELPLATSILIKSFGELPASPSASPKTSK